LVDYIEHFSLMIQWVNDILSLSQGSINSIQDIANGLNAVNLVEHLFKKRLHLLKERGN